MQQVSFLPLFSTTVQPLYSEPQGSITFVRYIQSSLYTNSPKKCGFHTWQFILGITVGLNSVDNIPSVAKASFPFPSFMGALATAFFEGWQFCKLLSSMLIADMLFYCIHRGHPTSDKVNQLNCVKQWIFSVLQIASVADIHTWQENYCKQTCTILVFTINSLHCIRFKFNLDWDFTVHMPLIKTHKKVRQCRTRNISGIIVIFIYDYVFESDCWDGTVTKSQCIGKMGIIELVTTFWFLMFMLLAPDVNGNFGEWARKEGVEAVGLM